MVATLTLLAVAVVSFIAWIVSTVGAGGGALLLVPAVAFLMGAGAVAPVVTLASLAGNPTRVVLFREHIDWRIVRWYLPGAVVGAFLGASAFTLAEPAWLQVVIGLFLVSTLVQYRFGRRARTFTFPTWGFLPAGLIVSFLSGLVGAIGPVLNPLYLNHGTLKEPMIATKSVNSVVMHAVKITTYAALGAITTPILLAGLAAGVAAVAASWVGKHILGKITDEGFRRFVIAFMAVSGAWLLWEQRDLIASLLGL